MSHQHHAPDFYTALRFTAEDIGKIYMFRNRYDQKLYTFELLDCVSMPLRAINDQLFDVYHIRPDVAVEQIWCRIKPDFDRESMVVGFDECYGDIYTEEADGPLAIGLQIKPEKEIGANAFTASALKASMGTEVSWKVEIFRPEDSHA